MAGKNLHQQVLAELGRAIVTGAVPPGHRTTVAQLEERYGISRSVAREVVRVLEALGLLRSSTKVGLTVTPSNEWNLLAPEVIRWRLDSAEKAFQLKTLTELRRGIEPTAARYAAQRVTWQQLQEMRRCAAEMKRLGAAGRGASPEFLAADIAFHSALLGASGNEMLATLAGTITAILTGRNELGLTPAHPAEENLDNHVRLADALADGDSARAEQLAVALVDVVEQEVAQPVAAS
ncbi:FadR/GntR family transcriptional regulator [Georgenia ruanii]|uniref:FCD domain-containing protein n=1 Tax=Georgenia ruanii TaxID=348442 RepID=A0A7J9UW57_9MICO|nr:FCD domain-containing protein [Georgenia ruanii]MPV88838.1 FCD domain-containing protein [Georgenia ruanii]